MILLAIETSGTAASVALMQGGALLAERVETAARQAAERLLPLCEEVLAGAGFCARSVDALAVSVGPGSFTGVRIGICAANALAQAADAPVAEVCSLAALARNAGGGGNVIAAVDARRERVYAAGFGEAPFAACILTLDELRRKIAQLERVTLVGDAALSYGSALSTLPPVRLGTREQALIYARSVAEIAQELYQRGAVAVQAQPVYLAAGQTGPYGR